MNWWKVLKCVGQHAYNVKHYYAYVLSAFVEIMKMSFDSFSAIISGLNKMPARNT